MAYTNDTALNEVRSDLIKAKNTAQDLGIIPPLNQWPTFSQEVMPELAGHELLQRSYADPNNPNFAGRRSQTQSDLLVSNNRLRDDTTNRSLETASNLRELENLRYMSNFGDQDTLASLRALSNVAGGAGANTTGTTNALNSLNTLAANAGTQTAADRDSLAALANVGRYIGPSANTNTALSRFNSLANTAGTVSPERAGVMNQMQTLANVAGNRSLDATDSIADAKRLYDDSRMRSVEVNDVLKRMQEGLPGLTARENQALRDAAYDGVRRENQARERQLLESQSRLGLRGGSARAAQINESRRSRDAVQDLERKLLIDNIGIKDDRLKTYASTLRGLEDSEKQNRLAAAGLQANVVQQQEGREFAQKAQANNALFGARAQTDADMFNQRAQANQQAFEANRATDQTRFENEMGLAQSRFGANEAQRNRLAQESLAAKTSSMQANQANQDSNKAALLSANDASASRRLGYDAMMKQNQLGTFALEANTRKDWQQQEFNNRAAAISQGQQQLSAAEQAEYDRARTSRLDHGQQLWNTQSWRNDREVLQLKSINDERASRLAAMAGIYGLADARSASDAYGGSARTANYNLSAPAPQQIQVVDPTPTRSYSGGY